MLSITKSKDKESSGWSFFSRSNIKTNPSSILQKLAASFEKELKQRFRQITSSSENLSVTEALHIVADNLMNVKLTVEKTLRVRDQLTEEDALVLLDEQIEQTKRILESETVRGQIKPLQSVCGRSTCCLAQNRVANRNFR